MVHFEQKYHFLVDGDSAGIGTHFIMDEDNIYIPGLDENIFTLLAENFICFTVDPYTKNDLKAAPELRLQKGGLVIRDRDI